MKWDKWDVEHPRLSEYGDFEHMDVMIRNLTPGNRETIDYAKLAGRQEELASYGVIIKPEK